MSLKLSSTFSKFRLKLIHIFGLVFMVKNSCYDRCYLKKAYTTVYCPYVLHSSREKLGRSFQFLTSVQGS